MQDRANMKLENGQYNLINLTEGVRQRDAGAG